MNNGVTIKNILTSLLALGCFVISPVQGQITTECGEPFKFLTTYSPSIVSNDSLPADVKATLTSMYGNSLMTKLNIGSIYAYNKDSLLLINKSVESAYGGVIPKYEIKFSLPLKNSFIEDYCGSFFFDSLWSPVSIYRGRDFSFFLPTKENPINSVFAEASLLNKKLSERREKLSFKQVIFYKNHICLNFEEKHFATKREVKRTPLLEGEYYIIDHYQSIHSGKFIGSYTNCCGILDR